ncbi:MAG TPA: TPM domain-containing protein [Candidatus Ozemobacteraceae bacterium]|nr:TPM domain-containing protein [Candidatus Ozemobacteraceae bacterium]
MTNEHPPFFSEEDSKRLIQAIQDAERRTSGEIRIHVEHTCTDADARVREVFAELGMDQTAERNGILFYLATESRLFAVLGDEGINEVVPEQFWNTIRDTVLAQFRRGDFVAGLTAGVRTAGAMLEKYFPRRADDVNELPDEISYGRE